MKGLILLAVTCISVKSAFGAGAGRAIPIATENFVVELFQEINPRIQYDSTNFLVDLSGNYANCNFIGRRLLDVIRNRRTPEGASIGVIQDYTNGEEAHTNAVDSYLRPVLESWVDGYSSDVENFRQQIIEAEKFGCSVRPGCRGQLSVACLFTPASLGENPIIRPTYRPTPRPTPRPTRPTYRPRPRTTPRPRPRPSTYIPPTISGEQNAKAFTLQQYDLAEGLTGQRWDSSHYLENLSGFETQCAMVHLDKFTFPYATAEAKSRGLQVIGLYGSSPNEGSTPKALEKILKTMKREALANKVLYSYFTPSANKVKSKMVGCSLIPDCIDRNQMWVVVSCVFEI